MSDQPSSRAKFFARGPAPQVDVKSFLNGLVDAAPEVQAMRKALAEADQDITNKDQRIAVLDNELTRITRMRDEWMAIANEMQVQLEVIASVTAQSCEAAETAARNIKTQAENSLRSAKERLARSGLAMPTASYQKSLASDEGARKIGEMFGANARMKVIDSEAT